METIAVPGSLSAEEAQRHLKRQEEIASAQAVPLPGPLLDAIDPPKKVVCGYELRPVVLSDIAILQRIDSPLISVGEIVAKLPTDANLETALSEALVAPRDGESASQAKARVWEGMIESFYILTHSPKEIRKLIGKGIPEFKEIVACELADNLSPTAFAEIQDSLAKNFAAAFSTVVGHEPDIEGNGSFRKPQASKTTG